MQLAPCLRQILKGQSSSWLPPCFSGLSGCQCRLFLFCPNLSGWERRMGPKRPFPTVEIEAGKNVSQRAMTTFRQSFLAAQPRHSLRKRFFGESGAAKEKRSFGVSLFVACLPPRENGREGGSDVYRDISSSLSPPPQPFLPPFGVDSIGIRGMMRRRRKGGRTSPPIFRDEKKGGEEDVWMSVSHSPFTTVLNYDMKLANSSVAHVGRTRKTFPLSIFKRRGTNTNSLLPGSAVDGGGGGLLFHSEGGGWTREREDFSSPKKAPEYSERKKGGEKRDDKADGSEREKSFLPPPLPMDVRKEMMLFVVMQYDTGNWTTKVRHFPISGSGTKRCTHESINMVVIFPMLLSLFVPSSYSYSIPA